MEKYKEVLAELLTLNHRSQRWLSKKVGSTQTLVNYVANGKRNLRTDMFVKWCNELDATVTVEWRNPFDGGKERRKWVL